MRSPCTSNIYFRYFEPYMLTSLFVSPRTDNIYAICKSVSLLRSVTVEHLLLPKARQYYVSLVNLVLDYFKYQMYTSDLMNYESLPQSWLLKKLTTTSFVSDFCLLKSSTVVHILPSKALQDYVVCVRSPYKTSKMHASEIQYNKYSPQVHLSTN